MSLRRAIADLNESIIVAKNENKDLEKWANRESDPTHRNHILKDIERNNELIASCEQAICVLEREEEKNELISKTDDVKITN